MATRTAIPWFSGGALSAMALTGALMVWQPDAIGGGALTPLNAWLTINLGAARWLFLAVATAWCMGMAVLLGELERNPIRAKRIAALDQMTDLAINLFVGIGVIWTAVGMRDALQAALGDPTGGAPESADAVLRALVDGGILLALSTTIVGGIGGYLLRLLKMLLAGAPLHQHYEQEQRADLRELLSVTERLSQRIDEHLGSPEPGREELFPAEHARPEPARPESPHPESRASREPVA